VGATEERKPPPRSARKRDLFRLAVARSDLAAAHDALGIILKDKMGFGHRTYLPLLYVAAVAYARPFTQNKPHGALPEKWAKFADPPCQRLHDQVLEMRNQYVAHSDQAARAVRIMPAGYVIPGANVPFVKTGISVSNIGYNIEFVNAVSAHIVELGQRIDTEVEALLDELYMGKEMPKEPFDLVVDDSL
jgi:hypothetical protein